MNRRHATSVGVLTKSERFAKLLVVDPDGTERVLIDPAELSANHLVTLDAWYPSMEGGRLAYALSEGGDEEASM